jgi:hypothetical protein
MTVRPSKVPTGLIIGTANYRLPAKLTKGIGRMIDHWAHFEFLVQKTIWMLVGVDEKRGRVAIKEPRIGDRFDMIAQLALVHNIQLKQPLFGRLKVVAEETSRWRDLMAHGVWVKDADGWKVQQTKGNHPKNVTAYPRSKKLAPEGLLAEPAGLQSIVLDIERLIKGINIIRTDLKMKLLESHARPPPKP